MFSAADQLMVVDMVPSSGPEKPANATPIVIVPVQYPLYEYVNPLVYRSALVIEVMLFARRQQT